MSDVSFHRIIEAAIFAASKPIGKKQLALLLPHKKLPKEKIAKNSNLKKSANPNGSAMTRLAEKFDDTTPIEINAEELATNLAKVETILLELKKNYNNHGIQLAESKDGFYFRTAPDVAPYLKQFRTELKRLSRAAMETLAIIAYHQPITRAEIETIRGVTLSRGTMDALIDAGWIKLRGRRKTIGNPLTFGTSDKFLVDFSLSSLKDLPGLDELKDLGLLDAGHDFSNIGMGDEAEVKLDSTEQLDLLTNSLDEILTRDEQETETTEQTLTALLMDEPFNDAADLAKPLGEKKSKKKS